MILSFLLLYLVNFFLYCKLYAMFSFCRKGTLHYILLLNLVKQIQWKHWLNTEPKWMKKLHAGSAIWRWGFVLSILLLLTFVNFYFVFLFSFVIFYFYTVNGISFCREGTLHYILLLNLVKQIWWKHWLNMEPKLMKNLLGSAIWR